MHRDHSNLCFTKRDIEAEHQRHSANSYIEVLDNNVPGFFQPGMIFQDDKASIHTARKVKKRFTDTGVVRLQWPVISRDLDPIENTWATLKVWVNEYHSHLFEIEASDEAYHTLQTAIEKEWYVVPDHVVDNVLVSIMERVQDVMKAGEWHIKR